MNTSKSAKVAAPFYGPNFCCVSFAQSDGAFCHYHCTREIGVPVKMVSWCIDCENEECEIESHKASNLPDFCSACTQPADMFAGDCLGNVHAACEAHKRYLGAWVRSVDDEVRCDGLASARFEDMAYGRD